MIPVKAAMIAKDCFNIIHGKLFQGFVILFFVQTCELGSMYQHSSLHIEGISRYQGFTPLMVKADMAGGVARRIDDFNPAAIRKLFSVFHRFINVCS